MKERLNKVLARAGIASRRGSDELIRVGSVSVNGRTVTELGTRVDEQDDDIRVNGLRIPAPPRNPIYLMLNKPLGYVTTLSDPQGRPTIRDLIPDRKRRVFPVGRLDFHSEGLLLLTDDGELCRDLMHPSRAVPKTYSIKVKGTPSPEALARLRRGISLEGKRTLPAQVRLRRRADNSWLEVTVQEGRKHQVRLMFQAIGHRVLKLRRISYAGISLAGLPVGAVRKLARAEVAALREASQTRKPRRRAGR